MTESRRSHRKKKSRKKKVITNILIIVGVLFIVTAAYGIYLYQSIAQTANEMHENLDREKSDRRDIAVNVSRKQPISILVLGVDARPGDRGRSDTMVLMTLNPNTDSMTMMSIPRDTRTKIVGHGIEDKINHAFAFGGADMAVSSVENLFDIPIDYVIQINMEGFKDMVDAVGGVTVDNPFAFNYEGEHFAQGNIQLTGEKALKYTRMRYEDPRGDLGRNDRQRQIIDALIHEGAQFSSFTRLQQILDSIGSNVRTNLTFDEMRSIFINYHDVRKNSKNIEVAGTGSTINGVWYYIVSNEEKARISNELKEHLELK